MNVSQFTPPQKCLCQHNLPGLEGASAKDSGPQLLHWLQLQTGFVGRCWISVLLCPYKPSVSRLTCWSEVEWDSHISDGSLDESQQISEGVQVFDKWVTTAGDRTGQDCRGSTKLCRRRTISSFPSVMPFTLWRSPAGVTTLFGLRLTGKHTDSS